jgi:hypothetical protein
MDFNPVNGDPMVTDNPVAVEKLSVECPIHGTVPVVCPRCAGEVGGRAHRGTTWKRKKAMEAMQTARRLLRASPVLRAFVEQAEQEMRFQSLCDTLGMSAEEKDKLREDMIGLNLALELADRVG